MKIKIDELKNISNKLFDMIIELKEINLDSDYYWTVPPDKRENISKEPDLLIGSLMDDLECLKKVFNGENVPTTFDFQRLANVLIAVQEKLVKG